MRHNVKSKKLHRDIDARRALIYALIKNVLENESIKTSKSKAKYIKGKVERIVSIAKRDKDDLSRRRLLLSNLRNNKTLVEIALKKAKTYQSLSSGFLRIQALDNKKGDNSEYVKLSWVDIAIKAPKTIKEEANDKKEEKPKKTAKKAVVKVAKETPKKTVKKVAKKVESKNL